MAIGNVSSQKPGVLAPKESHPKGSFHVGEDVTGQAVESEGVEVSKQMTG